MGRLPERTADVTVTGSHVDETIASDQAKLTLRGDLVDGYFMRATGRSQIDLDSCTLTQINGNYLGTSGGTLNVHSTNVNASGVEADAGHVHVAGSSGIAFVHASHGAAVAVEGSGTVADIAHDSDSSVTVDGQAQ